MSDNGVDDALQAFVLIRKIKREIRVITKACAGGMAGSTVVFPLKICFMSNVFTTRLPNSFTPLLTV